MDRRELDEALVIRIVHAPAAFVELVHHALPHASIISAQRPATPFADGPQGLAIVYERGSPALGPLAALSARMPTLVAAQHPNSADALLCLDNGADGYLDAALDPHALRNALLGIAGGEVAYGRDVMGLWLRRRQRRISARGAALTSRQREILEFIARGATDKEIAGSFGLPKSTVRKDIVRLLRRIGARNRAAAVAVREELGV